jgi:hypothetical protein
VICLKNPNHYISLSQKSLNEAKGGVMRLVVPGGRARETIEASGAVAVGMRTLSEGGTVGTFEREQAYILLLIVLVCKD